MRWLPRVPRIAGPIFGYELVRLARRGQHLRLRVALAATLLVTIFVVYANWFPRADPIDLIFGFDTEMSIRSAADFASEFMRAFLTVTLAAAVLLSPIYAAGAITEEIQRRSLEHLLATDLSNREIVLGKFLARSLHVAGILLTGLPILALTQLFGGIDMTVLLRCYAVIICTMASLSGLGLAIAVATGDLRSSLLRVYTLFGAISITSFCVMCFGDMLTAASPFHVLAFLLDETKTRFAPFMLAVFAAIHLSIAFTCVFGAIAGLRYAAGPGATIRSERHGHAAEEIASSWRDVIKPLVEPAPAPNIDVATSEANPTPAVPLPPVPWGPTALGLPVGPNPFRPRHPPVNEDDPLLWKETHARGGGSIWASNPGIMTCLVSVLLIGGGMIFMFLLIATVELTSRSGKIADMYNAVARWFGLILVAIWMLTTGLTTAVSIVRERERQTLDGLLTLPVDRRDIMRAKWRAAWNRGLPLGLWLIGGLIFCTLPGGLHLFGLPLAVALSASLALLATSLGLWLSTWCRTGFRAAVYFVVILSLFAAAPGLLAEFAEAGTRAISGSERSEFAAEFTASLSPVSAWTKVTYSAAGSARNDELTLPAFLGSLTCGVAALLASYLFWVAACKRMNRET